MRGGDVMGGGLERFVGGALETFPTAVVHTIRSVQDPHEIEGREIGLLAPGVYTRLMMLSGDSEEPVVSTLMDTAHDVGNTSFDTQAPGGNLEAYHIRGSVAAGYTVEPGQTVSPEVADRVVALTAQWYVVGAHVLPVEVKAGLDGLIDEEVPMDTFRDVCAGILASPRSYGVTETVTLEHIQAWQIDAQ
jgi:hypothetical protein